MKSTLLSYLLFVCSFSLIAQDSEVIRQINEDVYIPFSEAYANKNIVQFASLQSEQLIRISGDGKQVKSKSEYIAGIANWWKDSNNTLSIDFRFIERIVNEKNASERGIYKIKVNKGKENERYSYGKFHVILEKINSKWKFIVDYDSNEGNTIDEEDFQEASEM